MPTRPLTPSRARIATGGGSGGASPPERDVPFIVHRPGSQLGSMGACLDGIQYSLVDVAPTVAAMLRVPAPRHSAGTYIKPLFDAEESVVTVTTARRIEPPSPC